MPIWNAFTAPTSGEYYSMENYPLLPPGDRNKNNEGIEYNSILLQLVLQQLQTFIVRKGWIAEVAA